MNALPLVLCEASPARVSPQVHCQVGRINRSITSRQYAGGLKAPPPIVSRVFQARPRPPLPAWTLPLQGPAAHYRSAPRRCDALPLTPRPCHRPVIPPPDRATTAAPPSSFLPASAPPMARSPSTSAVAARPAAAQPPLSAVAARPAAAQPSNKKRRRRAESPVAPKPVAAAAAIGAVGNRIEILHCARVAAFKVGAACQLPGAAEDGRAYREL